MDRRVAFGLRMREIREVRGYSQERLADLACLHRTYIGGVERGERNVSLLNIWRIAAALGIDPGELFAAPGEENSGTPQLRHLAVSTVHRRKKERKWTKKSER